VATNSKKNARYDLNAADRRRNLFIQVGLTAIVVLLGVGLVLYIVMGAEKKPAAGESKSIRVTSNNLITKEGTDEPKAVLSMYEDFLCPACGNFEKNLGPTVNKLIDSGAVAADYYMVSILDKQGDGYSTRSSNAAYCVADASKDAFRRFHAALYAQQPEEGVGPFPDDARLIEVARQAGAGGDVPDCISKGRYTEMARGLASASNVNSTPTIRINGQDYDPTTPEDLVAKIKEIVGDVPGLMPAPPNAEPTQPGAPTPPSP
jgi:protein-disulfide isomerase